MVKAKFGVWHVILVNSNAAQLATIKRCEFGVLSQRGII